MANDEPSTPADTIESSDRYVIGVDGGTPIAPGYRDANGAKLD